MVYPHFSISGPFIILLGILLCFSSTVVRAQSPSDIDIIQQQNEQILRQQEQQRAFDQQQLEKQRERSVIELPVAPVQQLPAGDSTLCFTIQTIDVRGVKALDLSLIQQLIIPYQKQCLGLEQINELLKKLTSLYLDQGYVTTRAYLPQQNLSSEILIIQVVEGTVESFDTSSAADISVNTAFPGMQGEILNLRDIEQGVEQINRLAANRVRMELIPGSVAGASSIKLINQSESHWQSNFRIDNSGQEATGETQSRLYLGLDNAFGLNDFISLSYQADTEDSSSGKKSETISMRLEFPYGYWLFSLDASDFEFANRVEGQSQIFDTSGSSTKNTLGASRVINRNQTGKTEVITALTKKSNRNYVEDVKLETSSRNLAVAKIQLRHNEYFSDNQSLQASLTLQKGLDMFDSPDAQSSDAPQPQYTAWLSDVSYSRRFSWLQHNWSFSSSLSLQYSDDNLFGSEQFSVGGLYSVRGFTSESLAARAGAYWRNDLWLIFPVASNRLQLNSLTTSVGLDAGTIFNESDNPNNHEVIQGVALGLGLGGKHFSADLTYASALKRPQSFTGDKEHYHFSVTYKF